MNKNLKIIIYGIVAIIISYFIYLFYGIIRYSHSPEWQTYKQYMWLFKDSVRSNIDTCFSYSYVKKRDVYNNIHYRDSFNIIIWEFKDLIIRNIEDFRVNQNINLDNINFTSSEVLNEKTDLEITIKYGFDFVNTMNLNLDKSSKVKRNIKGPNYKGFYGLINKMSLSDKNNDNQIILYYTKGLTPTVLFLYKGYQRSYLIIINSEKPLDESIINMFNLN